MTKKMINKLIYLLIPFIIMASFGCSEQKEKIMTTITKTDTNNPIYELFIDARGCYFEILINDVPLYFHYEVGATAFRLPINGFIPKSGEQKISLKMISVAEGKPFPQGAEVSLTIDAYPKGEPRERKTVLSYKTQPFDVKNAGIFADQKLFTANVPYELTDWTQGVDLSKEDEAALKKEIEKKYIEYTDAFKNNNLAKYKELTKLRQENIFKSMYYTDEQKKQAEKSYISGISNDKVKLYPLENYKLVFYGNGRLVGLQKAKEAPGIFINNQDEKDAFMEYILFYRKSSDLSLEIIL